MNENRVQFTESHNTTLGTVHLCRDEIEVQISLDEHDRNRIETLNLFIDYYENRDEDGFVMTRKLDTVNFIFDPEGHVRKFNYDRHSFVDQFINTDQAKKMLSDTFPSSRQDIVGSVFNALKHHIVGHCDRNRISGANDEQ